jgi:transcriptional regulator with XRE-family HTH domain
MSRGLPLPKGKLQRARARRGWSITRLAEESGVAIGTVSRAEAGLPISVETIRRLAAAIARQPALPDVTALLDGDIDIAGVADG